MMTPKEAVQMYLRDGDKESVMAEIQRDARKGTVPVEDVRPLIELLRDNPNADVRLARYELRAKHPNLFTI